MSKSERKHLQHTFDKANNRGWNLGNWKTGEADSLRELLNAGIRFVKRNADSVENSTNLFNSEKVKTKTYRWTNSKNGVTYWVTQKADDGTTISVGSSKQ